MKTLTHRIAAVLGPALVAVTTSEALNLGIWHDVHPTLVYLNGLLLLVGGLVVVTNHNQWRWGGEFLVTLSGWLLVAAGAFRMFFPSAPQLHAGPVTYAVIAVIGILGFALSAFAFLRR